MSIRYIIHDIDISDHAAAAGGLDGAPAASLADGLPPAARAILRLQGLGDIGAVMLVPASGGPILLTTGFGLSRPDRAVPLVWIKRSGYLHGTESLVRLEWEPVVGNAPAGTLPAGFDPECQDNTIFCLDVEVCQVLMLLALSCARAGLNSALAPDAVEWYRALVQHPEPDLGVPPIDRRGRAATDLWTRRAADAFRRSRAAMAPSLSLRP